MKIIALAMGSWLLATPAIAAGQAANEVMPGEEGSQPPGGLAAGDVTGKFLLDANGVEIGRIAGVDSTGQVSVRTADGKTLRVALARLSLGNGPNTVIESGNSEADRLNRMAAGQGLERP